MKCIRQRLYVMLELYQVLQHCLHVSTECYVRPTSNRSSSTHPYALLCVSDLLVTQITHTHSRPEQQDSAKTRLSWPSSVAPDKFPKIPPLISQLSRYRGLLQLPRTNFQKYHYLLTNPPAMHCLQQLRYLSSLPRVSVPTDKHPQEAPVQPPFLRNTSNDLDHLLAVR
jgi:hypothetical protein